MSEPKNPALLRLVAARPDLAPRQLVPLAAAIDPTVAERGARWFNTAYCLPVRSGRIDPETYATETDNVAAATPSAANHPDHTAADPRDELAERVEARLKHLANESLAKDRARLRRVFLDFARDFAAAETRSEIVQVISNLDQYVNRALQR